MVKKILWQGCQLKGSGSVSATVSSHISANIQPIVMSVLVYLQNFFEHNMVLVVVGTASSHHTDDLVYITGLGSSKCEQYTLYYIDIAKPTADKK